MSEQGSVSEPDPERRAIGLSFIQGLLLPALTAAFVGIAGWPSSGVQAANLFASGDQARQLCTESDEWCAGFVTGALDGWAALEAYYPDEKYCLTTDFPVGSIVEAFRQELDRRPEPRDDPAAYILYERLIELFPCGAAPDPE